MLKIKKKFPTDAEIKKILSGSYRTNAEEYEAIKEILSNNYLSNNSRCCCFDDIDIDLKNKIKDLLFDIFKNSFGDFFVGHCFLEARFDRSDQNIDEVISVLKVLNYKINSLNEIGF